MASNFDEKEKAKGYVSDSATTLAVKAKLLAAEGVPSMSISVETTNGVVHLTGHVKEQDQIAKAENAAKSVEGVQSVQNDLVVKPE